MRYIPNMRVACTAALVVALLLATPVAAPAYTYEGPSQAVKEMEDRNAREGAEQAAKEKQEHEAKERQEREAREDPPVAQPPPREQPQETEVGSETSGGPATVRCVVPSLKGDSLGTAQKALSKAHCKLGKVSRPRTHHGALVVTGQSPKNGKKLASGAAVAVTLGSSKATHGRS